MNRLQALQREESYKKPNVECCTGQGSGQPWISCIEGLPFQEGGEDEVHKIQKREIEDLGGSVERKQPNFC